MIFPNEIKPTISNSYNILGGEIHGFKFNLTDVFQFNINHSATRQDWSVRIRISKIFFGENLNNKFIDHFNLSKNIYSFTVVNFQLQSSFNSTYVWKIPSGEYFLNIQNLENSTNNYTISFI